MDMTGIRQTRHFVISSLLIVWVFLFGVYGAEAFGYCEDNPEYANEAIEQTLSSPIEIAPQVSQAEIVLKLLAKTFSPIVAEVLLPLRQTLQLEPPRGSFCSGSPPYSTTGLFLSLSILRI